MRASTLILAVILACGPAQIEPDVDPIEAASARPSIRGTRLVAPSSDRAARPLEVTVTSPVAPGDTATASVVAAAGSRCTIEVSYRSGPSEAQGLDPQTAGDEGTVSWSWVVGINTTPGQWGVHVACAAPTAEATSGRAHFEVVPSVD